MPVVRFQIINERGEQIEDPVELDVAAVPAKDASVGLDDRRGVVVSVDHRYQRGRGLFFKEVITVTIRAN